MLLDYDIDEDRSRGHGSTVWSEPLNNVDAVETKVANDVKGITRPKHLKGS